MGDVTTPETLIPFSGDDWFDPLEEAVRFQVRGFIETMVDQELQAALGGRCRYERAGALKGYRNGRRERLLVGTFGKLTVSLPRARLIAEESGRAAEWRSQTIRRRDGQKVLLAVKTMGGETEAAWRAVLEDLMACGLKTPELLIVDGGKGLEAALAGLWGDVPVQRCTVHKERNLLAHAPKHLHDEIKADFSDMMYAEDAETVRKKHKAFLAKWRLRCRGVVDSLEEAGERLFTFLRYPPEQWKSLRTTNAIERLHDEFKRRIKTQCALPSAETVAMLF